jgi:hypothetical protein
MLERFRHFDNHRTMSSAIVLVLLLSAFFGTRSCVKRPPPDQSDSYISISAQTESCLSCHDQLRGYSEFHNPENIGCAVCHLGQPASMDKDSAHASLIRVPGNLNDASETCGTCHPAELHKIENSLMTTNSGIVAVDKFVFDETSTPDGHFDIRKLGYSAADQHLRNLCANCHLGAQKEEYGPISELSRGGGCNACHLNYSQKAKGELETYLKSGKKVLPRHHPSTDIAVGDMHCFGCHSRSSRISTNYMGWQETLKNPGEVAGDPEFRSFQDGRIYRRQTEDVHHASGMLCVDCHGVQEVMGDGRAYTHEEDAVKLSCSDCHYKETPGTIAYDQLDRESLLAFTHRGFTHTDRRILMTEKDSIALVNTYWSDDRAYLIGKGDGRIRQISPQPEICARDNAHKDLSCSSCHSSWAPRCIGCHNSFETDDPMAYDLLEKKVADGGWVEHVFEFSAEPTALGVRETEDGRHIEPAVPGMILTIDHDSFGGDQITGTSFKRLYAPNAPHTTGRQARKCASCHLDPVALGYGKGKLKLSSEGNKGDWKFQPEYAVNLNDGLPEDAWIPFLEDTRASVFSTRSDFRPFSRTEQEGILMVGTCLQCHDEDSSLMRRSLSIGIKPLLLERTDQCRLPSF